MRPEIQSEDRARMSALARAFPVLRGKPGVEEWDPETLDQWAAGAASSSERHAVAFVLSVWNCHHRWKAGKFDVMDALSTWDEENRQPFVEWAMKPYWM